MGNELSEFQDLCADLRAGLLIDHIKASFLPTVFNDQQACQLARALSVNRKVQRLDFNTAYLTSVGTRALGQTIRDTSSIRHVQLRYTRDVTNNSSNSSSNSTRVSVRKSRQALKALWEELQDAPSLQELYLVGTDLTVACKEFAQFLQTTKSLKALRASALPLITAANKMHMVMQGLEQNTSIELVELYELPNPMLNAFLMGLEGHGHLKWLAIDLEGGSVDDTSALQTFLQSTCNRPLEKFVWSRSANHMSLQPIFNSLRRNHCIKIFKVVDCTLTLQDAVQLKFLLRSNNTIESLLLSNNHLTNDQFREIASGLYRNLHVRELDLSNNRLHGLQASVILRSLLQRNRSIQQLDLSHNHFGGNQGMRCVTEGLARNTAVQELVLSALRLFDDDIMTFCSGLQLRTAPLKAIALSNNLIGPAGVAQLVHAFERCPIETIVLTNNRDIGALGARFLAEHLQSPTCHLKVLCLDGTRVGDEGLRTLSTALEQNTSLEYLSLDEIFFTSAGMESLAQSLPRMKKLIRLDFTWNVTLGETIPTYLIEALEQNTSLVQLDISGLEDGEWSEALLFYGTRNRYAPLLSGDNIAPPSLWPLALEKLIKSNIVSVAYYFLSAKLPWLLQNNASIVDCDVGEAVVGGIKNDREPALQTRTTSRSTAKSKVTSTPTAARTATTAASSTVTRSSRKRKAQDDHNSTNTKNKT